MPSLRTRVSCCLFWGLALAGPAPATRVIPPQKDWPHYTIRWETDFSLTDLMRAGMRPYHFPGLERSYLEAKHCGVVFQRSDGRAYPTVMAERVDIRMGRDWKLTSIALASTWLALPDARAQMMRWLPDTRRTEAELDSFLARVAADPTGFDAPGRFSRSEDEKFASQWTDGPLVYAVWFDKGYIPERPLFFRVKVQPRIGRDIPELGAGPVTPPPGFEDVSFATPKYYGPNTYDSVLESERAAAPPPAGVPRLVAACHRCGPAASARALAGPADRRALMNTCRQCPCRCPSMH